MAVGGVLLVFMSRGDDDKGGNDSPDQTVSKSGGGDPGVNDATNAPTSDEAPVEVPKLAKSTCPADLTNCVVASGRIIYEEKVDPDGDGDAHFVTASGDSVTGPGITIFDVNKDLRPEPLPGIGDLIGGAGPVYPGHAGQKQIEVIEFHVAH
ncbi:MAG: hypothetical protein ACSLFD_06925 [Solirubrobacterales bacterium]